MVLRRSLAAFCSAVDSDAGQALVLPGQCVAVVSIATHNVSASSSSSLSAPIRFRQRVIDERSSGSLWRKPGRRNGGQRSSN